MSNPVCGECNACLCADCGHFGSCPVLKLAAAMSNLGRCIATAASYVEVQRRAVSEALGRRRP